jgi:cAMP-specific phosphodiesterase 4
MQIETEHSYFLCEIDKQQELDLPSLRVEDTEPRANKKKEHPRHGSTTMSQISGVKRPLCHTNSFTGEKLPKYGVETPYEEELGTVSFIHFIVICSQIILTYT